jgi:hypothetical protein
MRIVKTPRSIAAESGGLPSVSNTRADGYAPVHTRKHYHFGNDGANRKCRVAKFRGAATTGVGTSRELSRILPGMR